MVNFRKVFFIGLRICTDFVSLFLVHVLSGRKGFIHLPPVKDKYLLMSVQELVSDIKAGKIKCTDVIKAFRKRIEDCEPKVNAVCEDRFDQALKEAAILDQKLAQERKSGQYNLLNLPLIGVPFSAKDCCPVAGMKMIAGFAPRKDIKAETKDAECIENLKKAGAIPLIVTNVPELAFWYDSANLVYGRTRNPYDLTRISGGSSGGMAANITYCGIPFGVGSDIAGSIRLPSHFCGIFGHCITPAVVEKARFWPPCTPEQLKCLSLGPMVRYSRDLIPVLKGIVGDRINMLPDIDKKVDLKKINIYCVESDGGKMTTPVMSTIKDAFKSIKEHFSENIGCNVQQTVLPNLDDAFDIYMAISNNMPHIYHCHKMANLKGEVNPFFELFKKIFGLSLHTFPMIVVGCIEKLSTTFGDKSLPQIKKYEDFKKKSFELLNNNGVIILPVFPEPAPFPFLTIPKVPNAAYSAIVSLLQCPVSVAPVGMTPRGKLPVGLQIIAAPFNDHISIAIATELESLFGGWKPPFNPEISN